MPKIKMLKDGVEVEIEVAEIFETQEAYDNAMRSASSKGKNEILKAINASSVEDAKSRMTSPQPVPPAQPSQEITQLRVEMSQLKGELQLERDRNVARSLGVKPELIDDMITLAKANKSDTKSFTETLKEKATSFGAIGDNTGGKTPGNPTPLGNQKTPVQLAEDAKKAAAEKAEMDELRNLDPRDR